jgi:hypothetical protein
MYEVARVWMHHNYQETMAQSSGASVSAGHMESHDSVEHRVQGRKGAAGWP